MENVVKFIIGILLIVLAIIWFAYERKILLKENKAKQYTLMSFTIQFIFGSITLIVIGITLIYRSI